MQDLSRIGEDLFQKIRGRFPNVTIGDEDGNVTNEPTEARFFDFDYKSGERKLGKVSVSISEDDGLSIIYSQDFIQNEDELTQKEWYNFLRELRKFSKKRLLNFDVRDITKSNLTKRDYKFLAANRSGDETMNESKLYGTGRVSYQNVDGARIVIKHNENINQEIPAARTRNIGSIYIESTEGERFKYPYRHLSGARAMARHVAEGGKPYDSFGSHITTLSEEMWKLRKFKNYVGRSNVMAESLAGYMDVVKERVDTIRKTINGLQNRSKYQEAIDSYETPVFEDVPEDVKENWVDQLTIRQFNEELKDVFPYIYRLVGEATRAKELGPEDLLGEELALQEFNIRTNKKFTHDGEYKNYDIYVNKQKDSRGYYMSYALRGDKEMQTLRGQGPNPQTALKMTKEKIDTVENKAERINSDASINLNVNFIKEELPQSTMTDSGEPFYAKLDQGPSLVIANEEWGDDAKELGFQKVAYKKLKSAEGVFSGGVFRMPAAVIASLDLVRHGRYLLGSSKRDSDGNYVFPMSFHSIAAAPNDPLKLGKPALGVNPLRVSEAGGKSLGEKFDIVRKTDGKVIDTFDNKHLANAHYHVEKGWAEVKPSKNGKNKTTSENSANDDSVIEDDDPCWKNYKQVGMKKKNGKQVPNCVPESNDLDESGLQYHTGVKKHGKEYMKKAAQAGRDGASQEELGRLRDKYSKAEKQTKEEFELEQAFEDTMGQFADSVCEECGNLSWRTLDEEKQKGIDGKVCWKGYRRQGTKMKGGRRVDNCVKVGESEDELDEAEVGTVYMRFRERKTPEGKNYLVAFAGFANSPEELQMDTASRKFMKLTKKEDIVKAVKDVKNDKVFVGAKDITVFVDNPMLSKKYDHFDEALDVLEKFGKQQGITVQYKDQDPTKKREKGSGKKRLPKGHAKSAMKNYKDAESETTKYFSIDNNRLMSFLRKSAPQIMNSFRPNLNQFVMDQAQYRKFRNWLRSEAVVARFGETQVRVDKEKSFSQEKGREFEGNAYANAVRQAKMNGKKKGDKVQGPDGDDITLEKEQKTPISEFILSYFDYTTGQFPKGETAVLTMIEKDYGEEFIEPAKQFIERINERVSEVMGYKEPDIQEDDYELNDISRLAGI